MARNFHKFLRNVPKQNDGFKKKRGWATKEDEPQDNLPKQIQGFQKNRLRRSNILVYNQRKLRREEKTLPVPITIDLIRIHFFTEFNSDLQKKFWERYGLSVIEYTNFNKSVLFEIVDNSLFATFSDHVQLMYNSADTESYEGKPYHLLALIFNFEYMTDKDRIGKISESGFLISLVTSTLDASLTQKELMMQFLNENTTVNFDAAYPEIIEVKNLSRDSITLLVKNFDIVRLVTSSRAVRLRPGAYGELRRDFGFEADVNEDLPVVGIIDSGVSNIEPLRPLLTTINYDHTEKGIHWDEIGHGTMVAGLIAFGDDFNTTIKRRYTAKARLAVLKVIHQESDDINIPRLLSDIRDARRRGIKLFNMSLNLPLAKIYNSSISKFAYELDRLAYEEDLLIFISVGNYEREDLKQLTSVNDHPAHRYPNFFYELNSPSDDHSCWFTNIQEPAESMNNLSIGALAGNLEGNMNHDITPASEYPAYYTRKFHYDYNQTINNTNFKQSQSNKFLNKPDLVFEGGDLFDYHSGIEILRSPFSDTEKYFGRQCGTSLATPLVTSLAAEIQNTYPQLRAQTIKALLINNAAPPAGDSPPAFQNFPIKLYQKLTGFGKVKKNNLLYSDDNTAVFVIEDVIDIDEVIAIPLYIPEAITKNGNKLHIQSTLCYSFLPVRDNHLNYLPLHITFGLFKNVPANTIATKNASVFKIKSTLSWAEDFHGVENRLFSNTQKKSFNLQHHDLAGLQNELCIAIRCTCKKEIPLPDQEHLTSIQHSFSLAISLTEIPEARASGELYNEINRINSVENISHLEGLAEADLSA